jgi:hypothetical protein
MTVPVTPDDNSISHPDPGGQINHPVTGPIGQQSGHVPMDQSPMGPPTTAPNAPMPAIPK